MDLLFIASFAVVAGLLSWFSSRFARTAMAEGERFMAVVYEHRRPTLLALRCYPYVEYVDAHGEMIRQRVEMPSKDEPSVAVGQQIEVVSYRGKLYYMAQLTGQHQVLSWIALFAFAWALLQLIKS